MPFPPDYIERVYAGVLGKIIGVYLGRPFEGWTYEKIMEKLGEISYYVHDRLGVPLVVTDDDIAGTFTFLRALPDHGNSLDLTPEQIGQTWLNYLIEKRTILWWGGLGNSTEHTAYLRLKRGIPAPLSGSLAVNGQVVAQQIGAQIFIDGWAMVAPGDPALAASLARRAGSVSHDGEAIYAAQVIAAMEAQAFVESDIERLIDTGLAQIPADCLVARMIADLRRWRDIDGDWRRTRERIAAQYGYQDYRGGCHVIPNHALVLLGLLYGEGDFQKSLLICNTSGWDTDCNSGNLGCLLGLRNGLAGFSGKADWRGPVADRLYLPSADSGRGFSDAVIETFAIANAARGLQDLPPLYPKGGARFHFELPGSVQGFQATGANLANLPAHSRLGLRSLHLELIPGGIRPASAATATFMTPEDLRMPGYGLMAAPTLVPGQTVRAEVEADAANPAFLSVALLLRHYRGSLQLVEHPDEPCRLAPGERRILEWRIPELPGPVVAVGVQLDGDAGSLYLDWLGWSGEPELTITPGPGEKDPWRKVWVNGIEVWEPWGPAFNLIQNEGRGLIITGTREWHDLRVSSTLTPTLLQAGGIAARVQGMRRFYALLLCAGGSLRLVKALEGEQILAETGFAWEHLRPVDLALEVKGAHLRAWIYGRLVFDLEDQQDPLLDGGTAFVVEEGHLMAEAISISPAG